MASRAAVNVCRQWVVSQFEFCGLSDVADAADCWTGNTFGSVILGFCALPSTNRYVISHSLKSRWALQPPPVGGFRVRHARPSLEAVNLVLLQTSTRGMHARLRRMNC